MAYKDILPAIYTVLEQSRNYDWVGHKMNLDDETMTFSDITKGHFYVILQDDNGGSVEDSTQGNYYNSVSIIVQGLVYSDKLSIVTGDVDYNNQIARGLMQDDILTFLSSCFNELCNVDVREIEYINDQEPDDVTKKGDRSVRRDYNFVLRYEQSRNIV